MIKRRVDPEKAYTKREIAAFLNNALICTERPEGGPITGPRQQKLLAYTKKLVEVVEDHVVGRYEDGELGPPLLSSEEAVYIMVVAAIYLHTRCVLQSEKAIFPGTQWIVTK